MRPRILLVEDDHDTSEALQELLESDDCDVVPVEALHQALAALAGDGPFDLVLLDLVLPDERELPAILAVRAATHAPLVAMTALPPDRLPRALPVEAVVFKPFHFETLERFIPGPHRPASPLDLPPVP